MVYLVVSILFCGLRALCWFDGRLGCLLVFCVCWVFVGLLVCAFVWVGQYSFSGFWLVALVVMGILVFRVGAVVCGVWWFCWFCDFVRGWLGFWVVWLLL